MLDFLKNPVIALVKQQLKDIMVIVRQQLPSETVDQYKIIVHSKMDKVFIVINSNQYELPSKGSMVRDAILSLSKNFSKTGGDLTGAEILWDATHEQATGTFYSTKDGEKKTEQVTI